MGTKLATCDPQPSLGGVYKLSAVRRGPEEPWTPVIKLSEQSYKRTIPGIQHVVRYYDQAGRPTADMLVVDEAAHDGVAREMVDIVDPYLRHRLTGEPEELLVKLVEHGRRACEQEGIEVARERCREALMRLDPAVARFLNPQTYPVGLEPGLAELRSRLALEERAESGRPSA